MRGGCTPKRRPTISFPWYTIFFIAFLFGWPWLLLVGAALGAVGLYAATGRWRRVLLSGAALLLGIGLLSGLAAVDHAISAAHDEQRDKAEEARLHETLSAPRTVLDSTLPAGTLVYWTDEARVEFRSLALPGPTRVFGLLLDGALEDQFQSTHWAGSLAEDQTIEGWPCRKGDVEFSYDRHLVQCVVAIDHPAFGFVVPAGTQLNFLPEYDDQSFALPADRAMRLPSLEAEAPALSEFVINHGIPVNVRVPDGKALVFRSLGLHGEIGWHYAQSDSGQGVGTLQPPADRLDGLLAAAFACGGHTFPPDSRAQLSLVSRAATLTEPQTGDRKNAAVDASGCLAQNQTGVQTGRTHVQR